MRGNQDAMARLAKRAKPAGYDDEDLPAKHEVRAAFPRTPASPSCCRCIVCDWY